MADALHDEALQRLAQVREDLATLREEPSASRMSDAESALAAAIDAVRSVTRASHDEALEAMTFGAAVVHIVEDAARRGRFCSIVRVAELSLDDADARFVLGAVRELSANVAVHAQATRLAVVITMEEGVLRLGMSDDGVGTAAELVARRAEEGHLGLALLHRRAVERGGTLGLSDNAQNGTTITIAIPVTLLHPA